MIDAFKCVELVAAGFLSKIIFLIFTSLMCEFLHTVVGDGHHWSSPRRNSQFHQETLLPAETRAQFFEENQ
jgi:hypothetical protein